MSMSVCVFAHSFIHTACIIVTTSFFSSVTRRQILKAFEHDWNILSGMYNFSFFLYNEINAKTQYFGFGMVWRSTFVPKKHTDNNTVYYTDIHFWMFKLSWTFKERRKKKRKKRGHQFHWLDELHNFNSNKKCVYTFLCIVTRTTVWIYDGCVNINCCPLNGYLIQKRKMQ